MAVSLDKKTRKYMYYGKIYKDGKCVKRYKKRGFNSKWEAQKAEAEFRKDFFMMPSGMNFSRLYNAYRESHLKSVKKSTIKCDDFIFNKIAKIIDEKDFLNSRDLQKVIDDLDIKYSKSYVTRYYNFLHKVYKFGVELSYIEHNPMIHVIQNKRLNERKKEMQIWEQSDFDQFIQEENDRMMKCFFMTLFYMGMRKGEVAALQWKDINIHKKAISITKTYSFEFNEITPPKTNNSYRTITIPGILLKELIAWYDECRKWTDYSEDKFVFGYYKPIPKSTIYKRYSKTYRKAALKHPDLPKIRIHDFRHSHASFLINNMAGSGFTDFDIAKRLGDTVNTLHKVYAHWFNTKDKSIVDMMNRIL